MGREFGLLADNLEKLGQVRLLIILEEDYNLLGGLPVPALLSKFLEKGDNVFLHEGGVIEI